MMPLRALVFPLGLLLAVVGCPAPHTESVPDEAQLLRIGVLPDQAREALELRYKPLVRYLENSVGIPAELLIPETYTDLLELFDQRQVDLVWFGGLTFVRAERASQAEPLTMRDVDLEFTTDFVVRQGATGSSIEDFVGQTFSFGPRLSTSGHLMPRFFLKRRGIEPEATFDVVLHSAGHDETLAWVRDGRVDIGAANSVIVEALLRSGSFSHEEVRVLGRTPPYKNYVWAVQPSLDRTLRESLLDAFLALDKRIPEQRALLDALGAGGFVPASRSDYDDLRMAAEELELLGSEGPR